MVQGFAGAHGGNEGCGPFPDGPWSSLSRRDQVHPDHTLRLADRLVAAGKDFELLLVPGAEHTFLDCLAYVRTRCWDFLVRELLGSQPPAYRPAPIAIGPEVLAEMFA